MKSVFPSRRQFLKTSGLVAGAAALPFRFAEAKSPAEAAAPGADTGSVDYTLRIQTSPVEIARNKIVSATTYNGKFPGTLLRFQEGRQVTIDVYNDTDTPEQLHWHGQKVPADVDGASEEGTPFIPAHGRRRLVFTPGPAGSRF